MDADRSRFYVKLAEVFEVKPDMIQPDFPLAGRWDSLAVLGTIAAIDQHFGVTIPVDELTQSMSVADLLALVAKNGQRAPA
jgi:acyl carrier protein